MRKNKKLFLTAAVSAALFVGGMAPTFAASMPSTYTKNGVTYDHVHDSGLIGIYYKHAIKGYAVVTYTDNTYKTVKSSVTGTYTGNALVASGENSSVSGGEDNTACGVGSSVSGGYANIASGDASGDYLSVSKYSSVSGGESNTASGWCSSVSGGQSNTASGTESSVSGGAINTASGDYSSVSGGNNNVASGTDSSVFGGFQNTASNESSSVFGGESNTASGWYSSAFGGQGSVVQGLDSVGVAGGSTGAGTNNSLAAGYQSTVTVKNGTAIGYQATTNKDGTIAFGHDAGDVSGYTVTWQKDSNGNNDYTKDPTIAENTYSSAYYNRLVKIADGIDAHDAVTVQQLNKAVANAGGGSGKTYTAGSDIDISSANAISVKKAGLIASGNTGLVTGGTVYSTTNALNTQITATSQAVESLSDKISTYGKTISSISTSVTNTLSSMKNTQANFVDTSLSNISSDGKDVIKQVVKDVLAAKTASTTSSTASAKAANLLKASFVAAPMRAAANLTAGDHVDISGNTISVKADGTVASGDTGLVTGGTMYDAVKDKADKSYVDEGLARKADVSYVDQGLSQKVNVSDFTPVKQQVETNTLDISALKTGKADADGSNINVGSFTAKLNTGKVEKGNTGLVSGGAVYDSLQTKADVGYVNTMGLALDSEIKGTAQVLHNEIQDMGNRLTKDINRVGAGSAALAALHPQDFNPDDKWDFAVGYGHYKNANASAVGAFYRPNAGTTVSLAATIGNGDPQVSAGVSFKIGMGKNVEKVVITKDKYDAQQKENQEMRQKNNEMEKALINQEKEIEALKQAIREMQTK